MLRILYFNTLCLLSAVLISAAPVKFDQRQEGELNVHASVENVLIVYVPSSSSELINLINLASSSRYKSKTLPETIIVKEEDNKLEHEPITIDIDIHGPIKRVETVVPQNSADVVVAQSQPISVNKPEEEKKSGPTLDGLGPADSPKEEKEPEATPEPSPPAEQPAAPSPAEPPKQSEELTAAPQEKPQEQPKTETEEPKAPLKAKSPKFIDISDGKPFELEDKDWNKLRMLSSGLEECSPGQFRNAKGLCEMIVVRQSEEQNLLPLLRLGLSPAN